MNDRDAQTESLLASLKETRDSSKELSHSVSSSKIKVDALQLQLSEAELERSRLVVQLCEAEQRLGSVGVNATAPRCCHVRTGLPATTDSEGLLAPESKICAETQPTSNAPLFESRSAVGDDTLPNKVEEDVSTSYVVVDTDL